MQTEKGREMSFANSKLTETLPFTIEDLRVEVASTHDLDKLIETLKTECKKIYEQEHLSYRQLGKVALAIDLIEMKTNISVYDYKLEVLKEIKR